jgi:hypothetical protein
MDVCSVEEEIMITYDEYKSSFLDYVKKNIEPTNERKSQLICEYAEKVVCLECFDIKRLFKERKYLPYSSLDFKGIYDVIECDVCSTGKPLYQTHDFSEKFEGNRIRYAYHSGDYEEFAREIYHVALENEIAIPDWAFMEKDSFKQKITNTNIEVDIKEAVETIESMVKAYFADPSSLTSFLENIQVKIKHFCSNSKMKKEICRRMDNNVFLLFDIEKETTTKSGSINLMNMSYSKKTDALNIHVLCVKPNNKAAEQLCVDMMNKKIKDIIETVQPKNINKTTISEKI